MRCSNCGNEINDNSSFCKKCGAKIEHTNDEAKANGVSVQEKSKKPVNKKFLIILVVVIIVIVVAGIAAYLILHNTTEKKADLEGIFYSEEYESTLEISGTEATLEMSGTPTTGKVDIANDVINWDDDDESSTYRFENDRIVLTTDGDTVSYKKASKEKLKELKEDSKYKYIGNYDTIESGEYVVGEDIKPGRYLVSFSFYDDDDSAKEKGTVVFTKDGKKLKTITIADLDSTSVVFEDGQTVTFEAPGEYSDFTLDTE
ncbi:MAG: zinc ribbon domain-containing protein [Eubacteriaceae bacterium]|nr:zinc ribbon domain-containing protein [Eubacteriaceae bacterium]